MSGRGAATRLGLALLAGLTAVTGAACGQGSSGAAIQVDHVSVLADQPQHVRVTGLGAGERVTIQAGALGGGDRQWLSFATFRADAHGVVDLATAAPGAGTYRQPEAMGLVRSLTSVDAGAGPIDLPLPAMGVTLTVQDGGRTLASRTLSRVFTAPGVTVRYLLPRDGFIGHYYRPAGAPAPRPAVLVFGGAEGGLSPYLDAEAALLASHGYPALAIAYFGLSGLPAELASVRLEYFAGALTWLRAQPEVDRAHVFVAGDSRGSEAALLLGVHRPDLVQGVVALVPSSVAHCAFPDCSGPAWTIGGAPVPYTAQFDTPAPTDDAASVIPVERIAGPVLLVCGELDSIWPSCPYARAIDRRLALRPGPDGHQLLAYPEADHDVGLLVPYLPEVRLAPDTLGDADAWPRLLALLGSVRGRG